MGGHLPPASIMLLELLAEALLSFDVHGVLWSQLVHPLLTFFKSSENSDLKKKNEFNICYTKTKQNKDGPPKIGLLPKTLPEKNCP